MEQPIKYSLNLEKVQTQMMHYSREMHPMILQQTMGVTPWPDDLESIYDSLLTLQASLARDLAILRLHLPKSLSRGDRAKKQLNSGRSLFINKLTSKECEVLTMFAKGYRYTEAAGLLDCKLATIQTHAKRIYKKLNVHSRSEAIFEARQLGIIQS